MDVSSSFWARRTISRRAALRAATTAGGGLVALSLAGCDGGSDKKPSTGGATGGTPAALDSTKGKPGGKIVIQAFGYAGGIGLVKTNNAGIAQLAGFTHSGLLEFKNGTPAVRGDDVVTVGPDLADALPEQVDELTYRVKIKSAKFHNGRPVTSEDVKYSFDRYAFWDSSGYKVPFGWLDKVETPDAQTAVIKTKFPYGETVFNLAARDFSFILAKEHEESPDADKKLMGSGPFLFVDTTPPVSTRFKKNPDYFNKPYPYFDELELLGQSDFSKKVSDFISRQTHMTYWHGEEEYDQIKAARPDAYSWRWPAPGWNVTIRTDQPPLNDKRVRQALSMGINRKEIRDAVTKGRGEDDQLLSWTNPFWGGPRPKDLGAAAKYWEYNPAEAKKLLAAAAITQPIDVTVAHWGSDVIGQGIVDAATLTGTQWRTNGLVNPKDTTLTFAQTISTVNVGNYDGMYVGTGGELLTPYFGINLKNRWGWPAGSPRPGTNIGYVNNPQLTALLDRQLTQLKVDERKQTLRQIGDIFAEEQYRFVYSNYFYNYFGDPTVKNMQVPILAFNSGIGYTKYWWFDKT